MSISQFRTTNIRQHHSHQRKSWDLNQKIVFLLKFMWWKWN